MRSSSWAGEHCWRPHSPHAPLLAEWLGHTITDIHGASTHNCSVERFVADALLVAAGDDPFALVEEAVIAAAKHSGGAKPLRNKQVPATADGFGWCTWDAFYTRVSAAGVQNLANMQVLCVYSMLRHCDARCEYICTRTRFALPANTFCRLQRVAYRSVSVCCL